MPDARGGRWCLLAVGTDRVFGAFDNSFIGLYFKLEISVAIFALQDPRSAVHIYPAFQEADNNFSAFPMYATASEYESIARSSKSLASTSSQRIFHDGLACLRFANERFLQYFVFTANERAFG
jgi:hypothetical protein